jgi:hypothetical protein
MTNIPTITPEKIVTTIKNKKTGEVYDTEEALKAANIPEEDVQRDVTVYMPPLDLFAKTK